MISINNIITFLNNINYYRKRNLDSRANTRGPWNVYETWSRTVVPWATVRVSAIQSAADIISCTQQLIDFVFF